MIFILKHCFIVKIIHSTPFRCILSAVVETSVAVLQDPVLHDLSLVEDEGTQNYTIQCTIPTIMITLEPEISKSQTAQMEASSRRRSWGRTGSPGFRVNRCAARVPY